MRPPPDGAMDPGHNSKPPPNQTPTPTMTTTDGTETTVTTILWRPNATTTAAAAMKTGLMAMVDGKSFRNARRTVCISMSTEIALVLATTRTKTPLALFITTAELILKSPQIIFILFDYENKTLDYL
jgi:hypothetical protein